MGGDVFAQSSKEGATALAPAFAARVPRLDQFRRAQAPALLPHPSRFGKADFGIAPEPRGPLFPRHGTGEVQHLDSAIPALPSVTCR
jgi:hypothetical protein